MNRLTKQYTDTKRYYSIHTFNEVVQRLGKLEDLLEKYYIDSIKELEERFKRPAIYTFDDIR